MESSNYVSTTNACKLCTPLGASLAFRGIEDCVPFLHGSQGCATYMRRYIISHYREPMDIASSALGEKQAVFGGGPNLKKGLLNVMKKYGAQVIGVATTCLTETIGDDVPSILDEFRKEFSDLPLPALIHASTPSYSGTQADGWREAVRATVEALAVDRNPDQAGAAGAVNVFPSLISCEDTRHLKDIFAAFGVPATILPDLSETLDGPVLDDYRPIPTGGTPLSAIRAMPMAAASLELGRTLEGLPTAGRVLNERFGVPRRTLGLPVGLRETDALCRALEDISGRPTPRGMLLERGRLVDALVDGHKYIFGKRAVVYGEEDLVVGLVSFLSEIGVRPVLAATGGKGRAFARAIADVTRDILPEPCRAVEGVDFHDIAEQARDLAPDLLVGHSKGYSCAKEWNVPLVRVGFPIHDRFGGQRILHVGYRGAQALLDTVVNTVLAKTQTDNPIGYGYL